MTINVSDVQSDLDNLYKISVEDFVAMLAWQDFNSLVDRVQQEKFPDRGRKTSSTFTGGPDGTALSTVATDIRNNNVGFEVYLMDDTEKINVHNKCLKKAPALCYQALTYHVDAAGSIYFPWVASGDTKTFKLQYFEKRTRVDTSGDPASTEFTFDQDLEAAFRDFMQAYYFKSKMEPVNMSNARQEAMEQIEIYFSQAGWA